MKVGSQFVGVCSLSTLWVRGVGLVSSGLVQAPHLTTLPLCLRDNLTIAHVVLELSTILLPTSQVLGGEAQVNSLYPSSSVQCFG